MLELARTHSVLDPSLISMLDVKNLIGEALNGVQKSNPMPNSKLDIMECILSGFNSAIIWNKTICDTLFCPYAICI